MTTEYTPSFRFNLPDFRMGPWHDLVNGNTTRIDQILLALYQGVDAAPWENNHLYTSGTTAIDLTDNSFWVNAFEHTSAPEPTTFAEDRTANPTYWIRTVVGITPRGQWENDTHYLVNDLTSDAAQAIIALCIAEHDSIADPGTIRDDAANWTFLIDMSGDLANRAEFVSYDNTASGAAGEDLQATTDDLYAKDAAQGVAIAANAVAIADHEIRIDSHDTEIDALQTSDTAQNASIATLASNDTNQDIRLTAVEGTTEGHETRIDNLEAGAGGAVVISDTPPVGMPAGMLWYESDTGLLYINYDDGGGLDWVLAVPDVSGFVEEAPNDGALYGRKSVTWTEINEASTAIGEWSYINTTSPPPSSGQIRLNNAAQASATHLYISAITALNKDVSRLIPLVCRANSRILLQNKDDATQYVIYQIASDAVISSGYSDITVTLLENGAALPSGQRVLFVVTNAGVVVPDSTKLNVAGGQTTTGGFRSTAYDNGTKSSGTLTPDAYNGNYQYYTNNGAHTLAAPANDCGIDILVTNGASAGAITFSGFTVGSSTGDTLTTTNAHKFIISVRRINGVSTYVIKALQ